MLNKNCRKRRQRYCFFHSHCGFLPLSASFSPNKLVSAGFRGVHAAKIRQQTAKSCQYGKKNAKKCRKVFSAFFYLGVLLVRLVRLVLLVFLAMPPRTQKKAVTRLKSFCFGLPMRPAHSSNPNKRSPSNCQ